jgi:phenylacetic acid degradation operon negative regulatory protein
MARLLKSKSLIFDVYGAFVRDLGGWLAVADLVSLLGHLGVEEQVVRSSVSRFTRKGLLARSKVDGQVGYELTEEAERILADGDKRIFSRLEPARIEDGWVLATFSVPEEIRSERHQLRTQLGWLGFGNLGGGVWIAPRRVYERTHDMVVKLGLEQYVDLFEAHYRAFEDLEDLVGRCWDLSELREAYRAYVEEFQPVLDGHDAGGDPDDDPRAAFVDYVEALHEWRKLPFMDPGLPPALLPEDWEGSRAAATFRQLREHLEAPARRHVVRVVSSA